MADIGAIAMRYANEVWNNKNLDAVDGIFTADHVYHDTLIPDLPSGPEGVRQRRSIYLGAIPDGEVEIHDLIGDGDRLAATWTFSGTNAGEIMGMPATGKKATITGSHFFRFEGERIAETWTYPDNLGLLQQLGLVAIGPPT